MDVKAIEAFWRAWRVELAKDLGARLAETIGVPPPADPRLREVYHAAVELEAEAAED